MKCLRPVRSEARNLKVTCKLGLNVQASVLPKFPKDQCKQVHNKGATMKSHDVINKEFNAELLETLTAFCKHAKTVYPEIDPKESISLVLCDYMQRWLKDADGHAELR